MTTGYSVPAGSTALSPEQEFSDPSIPQYSAEGGDWQEIVEAQHRDRADRMIINLSLIHI